MYKGRAIYNPSGKAGEYAEWACNFYVGCSNGCTYCYLKKGRGKKHLGGDVPTLKKCFHSIDHALAVFTKELTENVEQLRKHGLFFTFTSDPCLPETIDLTFVAIDVCILHGVPVKILTKCTDGLQNKLYERVEDMKHYRDWVAVGFTLTGCNEREPNASPHDARVVEIMRLDALGFRTFASIEPVITAADAIRCANDVAHFCKLLKVGLESGADYDGKRKEVAREVIAAVLDSAAAGGAKVYLKDSIISAAGYDREMLETQPQCVGRDYNLFKNESDAISPERL